MSTYKERLDAYIGHEPYEGEKRYYGIPNDVLAKFIKKNLEGNFSVNLWTFELTEEQIAADEKMLTEAGIVHYYDDVIQAFICFNNETDMKDFRKNVMKELIKDIYDDVPDK